MDDSNRTSFPSCIRFRVKIARFGGWLHGEGKTGTLRKIVRGIQSEEKSRFFSTRVEKTNNCDTIAIVFVTVGHEKERMKS